ncbi:unnamed protein product, partial [Amoebophrya sp. A120]
SSSPFVLVCATAQRSTQNLNQTKMRRNQVPTLRRPAPQHKRVLQRVPTPLGPGAMGSAEDCARTPVAEKLLPKDDEQADHSVAMPEWQGNNVDVPSSSSSSSSSAAGPGINQAELVHQSEKENRNPGGGSGADQENLLNGAERTSYVVKKLTSPSRNVLSTQSSVANVPPEDSKSEVEVVKKKRTLQRSFWQKELHANNTCDTPEVDASKFLANRKSGDNLTDLLKSNELISTKNQPAKRRRPSSNSHSPAGRMKTLYEEEGDDVDSGKQEGEMKKKSDKNGSCAPPASGIAIGSKKLKPSVSNDGMLTSSFDPTTAAAVFDLKNKNPNYDPRRTTTTSASTSSCRPSPPGGSDDRRRTPGGGVSSGGGFYTGNSNRSTFGSSSGHRRTNRDLYQDRDREDRRYDRSRRDHDSSTYRHRDYDSGSRYGRDYSWRGADTTGERLRDKGHGRGGGRDYDYNRSYGTSSYRERDRSFVARDDRGSNRKSEDLTRSRNEENSRSWGERGARGGGGSAGTSASSRPDGRHVGSTSSGGYGRSRNGYDDSCEINQEQLRSGRVHYKDSSSSSAFHRPRIKNETAGEDEKASGVDDRSGCANKASEHLHQSSKAEHHAQEEQGDQTKFESETAGPPASTTSAVQHLKEKQPNSLSPREYQFREEINTTKNKGYYNRRRCDHIGGEQPQILKEEKPVISPGDEVESKISATAGAGNKQAQERRLEGNYDKNEPHDHERRPSSLKTEADEEEPRLYSHYQQVFDQAQGRGNNFADFLFSDLVQEPDSEQGQELQETSSAQVGDANAPSSSGEIEKVQGVDEQQCRERATTGGEVEEGEFAVVTAWLTEQAVAGEAAKVADEVTAVGGDAGIIVAASDNPLAAAVVRVTTGEVGVVPLQHDNIESALEQEPQMSDAIKGTSSEILDEDSQKAPVGGGATTTLLAATESTTNDPRAAREDVGGRETAEGAIKDQSEHGAEAPDHAQAPQLAPAAPAEPAQLQKQTQAENDVDMEVVEVAEQVPLLAVAPDSTTAQLPPSSTTPAVDQEKELLTANNACAAATQVADHAQQAPEEAVFSSTNIAPTTFRPRSNTVDVVTGTSAANVTAATSSSSTTAASKLDHEVTGGVKKPTTFSPANKPKSLKPPNRRTTLNNSLKNLNQSGGHQHSTSLQIIDKHTNMQSIRNRTSLAIDRLLSSSKLGGYCEFKSAIGEKFQPQYLHEKEETLPCYVSEVILQQEQAKQDFITSEILKPTTTSSSSSRNRIPRSEQESASAGSGAGAALKSSASNVANTGSEPGLAPMGPKSSPTSRCPTSSMPMRMPLPPPAAIVAPTSTSGTSTSSSFSGGSSSSSGTATTRPNKHQKPTAAFLKKPATTQIKQVQVLSWEDWQAQRKLVDLMNRQANGNQRYSSVNNFGAYGTSMNVLAGGSSGSSSSSSSLLNSTALSGNNQSRRMLYQQGGKQFHPFGMNNMSAFAKQKQRSMSTDGISGGSTFGSSYNVKEQYANPNKNARNQNLFKLIFGKDASKSTSSTTGAVAGNANVGTSAAGAQVLTSSTSATPAEEGFVPAAPSSGGDSAVDVDPKMKLQPASAADGNKDHLARPADKNPLDLDVDMKPATDILESQLSLGTNGASKEQTEPAPVAAPLSAAQHTDNIGESSVLAPVSAPVVEDVEMADVGSKEEGLARGTTSSSSASNPTGAAARTSIPAMPPPASEITTLTKEQPAQGTSAILESQLTLGGTNGASKEQTEPAPVAAAPLGAQHTDNLGESTSVLAPVISAPIVEDVEMADVDSKIKDEVLGPTSSSSASNPTGAAATSIPAMPPPPASEITTLTKEPAQGTGAVRKNPVEVASKSTSSTTGAVAGNASNVGTSAAQVQVLPAPSTCSATPAEEGFVPAGVPTSSGQSADVDPKMKQSASAENGKDHVARPAEKNPLDLDVDMKPATEDVLELQLILGGTNGASKEQTEAAPVAAPLVAQHTGNTGESSVLAPVSAPVVEDVEMADAGAKEDGQVRGETPSASASNPIGAAPGASIPAIPFPPASENKTLTMLQQSQGTTASAVRKNPVEVVASAKNTNTTLPKLNLNYKPPSRAVPQRLTGPTAQLVTDADLQQPARAIDFYVGATRTGGSSSSSSADVSQQQQKAQEVSVSDPRKQLSPHKKAQHPAAATKLPNKMRNAIIKPMQNLLEKFWNEKKQCYERNKEWSPQLSVTL